MGPVLSSKNVLIFCIFEWIRCSEISEINGPIFIKEPRSNIVYLHSEGAILDCIAHAHQNPKISWIRITEKGSRESLRDSNEFFRVLKNNSLQFLSFASNLFNPNVHGSEYRCMATNRYGSILSTSIKVRAVTDQYQDQVKAQVYDSYAIPGNPVIFKCHIPTFYKNNLEVVSWIREDNFKVTDKSEGDEFWMSSDGNLHVKDVDDSIRSNLGYWCQIRNRYTGKMYLSQSAGRIVMTDPKSGLSPTIIDLPKLVYVQLGSNIKINCLAQSYPLPTYEWIDTKNGNKLSSKSMLFLNDLHVDGLREYTCVVTNRYGEDSKTVKVIVRGPLEVSINPPYQRINLDDKAIFRCKISGYPIKSIEWLFNGNALRNGKNGIEIKDNELIIRSIKRSHEGMYQCIAMNDFDSKQATAQLALGDVSPTFLRVFKPNILQPGPSISLECMAVGRPSPVIRWVLNGKIINASHHYEIGDSILDNGTVLSSLTVKSIRAENGGEYACIAKNKIKSKIHSEIINVYGLPLVHKMNDISVVSGTDQVIKCYVGGYPIKSIKWRKEGKYFFFDENIIDYENGTMEIRKISKGKNEGRYICKADNGRGQSSESSFFLKVLEKPTLVNSKSTTNTLAGGTSFSTVCSILSGDDPIQIFWQKNNSTLILGDGIDVSTTKRYSLLQIREIKQIHSGTYNCVAQNIAGAVTKSVMLNVMVSPSWINKPFDKYAVIDEKVIINCNVQGFPQPKIKWVKIKNNKVSHHLEDTSKYRKFDNGTMVIKSTMLSDNGTYSCMASNGINPDLITSFNIFVGLEPKLEIKQNKISGGGISLICKTESKDKASISWLYNNMELSSTNARIIKDNSNKEMKILEMKIIKLSNKYLGEYHCVVTNMYGKIKKLFLLKGEALNVEEPTYTVPEIYSLITTTTTSELSEKKVKEIISSTRVPPVVKSTTELFVKSTTNPVRIAGSKDKDRKEKNQLGSYFDFKTVMFIVPASAVIILLIALIITFTVYLLIKRKNNRQNEADAIRRRDSQEYKGSLMRKKLSPHSTIDRRYGVLNRPLPMPNSTIDRTSHSNQYEIPDYYSGVKPYATLQNSTFQRNSSRCDFRPDIDVTNIDNTASV